MACVLLASASMTGRARFARRALRRHLSVTTVLPLLVACSDASPSSPSSPTPDEPTDDSPPSFDPAPCAHLVGGGRGEHSLASDLGRAHALARYFSVETKPRETDAKLADALDTISPNSPDAVKGYAQRLSGACFAAAGAQALGPSSVTMHDGVAVVVPGTGDLPPITNAKSVAVDLRELPDSPEAHDALERAMVAVVAGDLRLLNAEMRSCNGQPDEVYSLLSTIDITQYACKTTTEKGVVLTGKGTSLPLAVLSAPRMTPLAAWGAITLRARAGAAIIGESISTEIAESRWVGVGDAGLAVRTKRLLLGGKRPVPDVVAADIRTVDPLAHLAKIEQLEVAELSGDAEAARPAIAPLQRPKDWGAESARPGDGRAALIAAYASARTFFSYFDIVGDTVDARLDECLATLDTKPGDRWTIYRTISRFAEALHDGHAGSYDKYRAAAKVYSPVTTLPIGSELVVAISKTPLVHPGDVVISVDGVPAAERVADLSDLISGSPQKKVHIVAEALVPAKDSVVVLRAPDGATRTETLSPSNEASSNFSLFDRPRGMLTDLGAADVYYVCLDTYGKHAPTVEDLPDIRTQMAAARGVVLDMRGYPDAVGWEVLAHVANSDSFGPKMAELMVTPDRREIVPQPTQLLSMWGPAASGYAGPVVVLTGARTQSQAEHWTSFFVSKKRGKIVGGATSGANGTITGVQLPGGFGMTFTGMRVDNADGSPFHSHGIAPDVEVAPTITDLRDGKDTVLLRAIQEIP
ncbi:MAG: hypothetical protein BGO98_04480 [Myxococcales bacterium 68-20]|nr:MAG: hypothetical protein BGO98_04480 [Myxococcales bacterium 68-20]